MKGRYLLMLVLVGLILGSTISLSTAWADPSPENRWFSRPVHATEWVRYTASVDSSHVANIQNAVNYWNSVGSPPTINNYDANLSRWNQTDQVDLLYDAIPSGTSGCYYSFAYCVPAMPADRPDGWATLAQWYRFQDLNVAVVQWNTSHWNDNFPNEDGYSWRDVVMRHELVHDHFLADIYTVGYTGLSCGSTGNDYVNYCHQSATLNASELSLASSEYAGRPQAPTNLYQGNVTFSSIGITFSLASNADSLQACRSTRFGTGRPPAWSLLLYVLLSFVVCHELQLYRTIREHNLLFECKGVECQLG